MWTHYRQTLNILTSFKITDKIRIIMVNNKYKLTGKINNEINTFIGV
jgi:hypothetical protein